MAAISPLSTIVPLSVSHSSSPPSPFCEVKEIYTPPHPFLRDLAVFDSYAKKIVQLKTNPNVMGVAFASRQNGDLFPVYITCRPWGSATMKFNAYALQEDEDLGEVFAHVFLKSNRYLGHDPQWAGTKEEFKGYGPKEEEVEKVLLDMLQNNSSSKNIGVLLNKAIHQKFIEQCEGRVVIKAITNSQPFHYKLGFRALDPKLNALYAEAARSRQAPQEGFEDVYMYLPDAARDLWLKEVRVHPIGFPSWIK